MNGEKVITKCEIAMTITNFRCFRAIRKTPIMTSRNANDKRHNSSLRSPKQSLQAVTDPISSAGLKLGKNFNIPK